MSIKFQLIIVIFLQVFWPIFNINTRRIYRRMGQALELYRGFICGGFAGSIQVLVMQPFEIIKVRLVNQSLIEPEYLGIKHCIKRIFQQEGLQSFYKGTSTPLIGYGIQGALTFGSYEFFKKFFKFINRDEKRPQQAMPMTSELLCGSLSGVISAIAINPSDLTRIMMQKQIKTIHKGSLDAGKYIYRNYGFKGLYLGFNSTLIKEVTTNAIYFYTYQYIMRLFAPQGCGSRSTPITVSFFAGGMAGLFSQIVTHPIDYIKTRIQSQNLTAVQYKNSIHCAKELYKIEGIRTFSKGLGITFLRSFPVNGLAFFSYQYLMRTMGWKK